MKRLGLILSVVVLPISVFALNDLGDIAEVRAKHPDCFRPGSVLKIEHAGEDWYVYCGEAEKCFKDENDSELYEEAVVQAKMHLFKHFAKDDPKVQVEIVGARKMYQFQEGVFRCVVMGALAKNVKVISGKELLPAIAKAPVTTAPRVECTQVATGSVTHVEHLKTVAPVQKKDPPKQDKVVAPPKTPVNAVEKKLGVVEKNENENKGNIEISESEKLDLLRARLEKNPQDFHTRIRMGRIFAAQGKIKRALNNYNDAARLIVQDDFGPNADKADDLLEIAKYEESHNEYSRALKHYRALLRMRDGDKARYANARISELLLR